MAHKLFFSSCFEDPLHVPLPIRDRVREFNGKFKGAAGSRNLPIWMAEDFEVLSPDAPTLPIDKALFCVEGVQNSDAYVAVIKSRRGSGVTFTASHAAQVSYFELEIYEAALLQKPAHIFLLKGADLEPRTKSLLELLGPALPGLCWEPMDEDKIMRRVEGILRHQMLPAPIRGLSNVAVRGGKLISDLTSCRHKHYDPARDLPSLRFLNGELDPKAAPPDRAFVEAIIARASEAENHNTRLVLLWMAIRELMGAPPNNLPAGPIKDLWEAALSSWSTAGAWFGLHGHPYMGCLAALGSLSEIHSAPGGTAGASHGALASEYYSIAKRIVPEPLRVEILDISRGHVDAALRDGETANKLALRGSIRWAQGDKAGALVDYQKTVFLRENVEGASESDIGQAQSELGFALLRTGRARDGIGLMERGADRMAGEKPTGFEIRGLRKLGRSYLMAGSPIKALDTLSSAYRKAVEIGAKDQISQIDRLAARIDAWRKGRSGDA